MGRPPVHARPLSRRAVGSRSFIPHSGRRRRPGQGKYENGRALQERGGGTPLDPPSPKTKVTIVQKLCSKEILVGPFLVHKILGPRRPPPPPPYLIFSCPRGPSTGGGMGQGCIRKGEGTPPPSSAPSLCPATVPLTDNNRPQPLWKPPPTACLTASGAASDVPALLMHPWEGAVPSGGWLGGALGALDPGKGVGGGG